MGSPFPIQSYYRPPLSIDTEAQKYFDEENTSVIGDSILEPTSLDSSLEMSPPMINSRRDSFAISSALFSPKTEDWQHLDMQPVPSNNPFLDQHSSNNPFMRLDHHQPHLQPPHPHYTVQGQWPITTQGPTTPLQPFDGLPAEFHTPALFDRPAPPANPSAAAAAAATHHPQMGQTPFSNPSNQVTMFQQLNNPAAHPIPASPARGDHWVNRESKGQPLARDRANSPLMLRRGDGIRKKNARFDIPAERNLSNIDQLISQSTDEQEIKELKQQKRLLRNRQAALDSRQRKKLHTERLEDDKKRCTQIITDMDQEIEGLREQISQLLREKQQMTDYFNLEKEETIRTHTLETGELRKKIGVLANHVQSLENGANAAPGTNGYSGAYGDMEGLTMVGNWENPSFLNEFSLEQQQPVEVKQEMEFVPAKKPEVTQPAESDKPSPHGGLLIFLFLMGAFVLSNRSPPSIPHVSDDVRAASATVLENVFKDAGVSQASSALAPQPSCTSLSHDAVPSLSSIAGHGAANVMPSTLDDLADSLAQPTQEQTNEQIFSLTAAQYNGVTSQDFLQNPPAERTTSQGRRNLAEALTNMRNNQKQSAAEVYTRSLLWDQIPRDVVRNFAKMVAECNAHSQQSGSAKS